MILTKNSIILIININLQISIIIIDIKLTGIFDEVVLSMKGFICL